MRYLISIPLLLLLGGCADMGYYWHSARGHLEVMDKRVAIEDLLAEQSTTPELRERLTLVREIREFSVTRLDLPDNDSYLSYVELDRPYLVQNLFAAPEFSTRLRQWCYPIIGCASYRGYYDETRLLAYVEELETAGLEVHVGRVSAYSTLGWFDDPVLSSFINWPDFTSRSISKTIRPSTNPSPRRCSRSAPSCGCSRVNKRKHCSNCCAGRGTATKSSN
ncbi:MAG: hypothetical protein GWP56_13535 [Gammaproteobacteria bacterium]|nr:hypothetical protein [Gammaproteobacteria bacterium]